MTRQILLTQNLHWIGQKLTQKEHKRFVFDRLRLDANFRPMVFLTGMRRTGKSTLIKQLLQDLQVDTQLVSEQFLFWEWHSQNTSADLENLIEFYLNEVANLNTITYLFFDEIQFIPNYENVIKLYYDRYENLRFILTGSLSFSYKKRMNESLAGRFITHRLYPLCFEEYLIFTNKTTEIINLRQARSTQNLNQKQGLAKELNHEFRHFLKFGRFPDTLEYTAFFQLKSYLDSILNQSLNQDSLDYFQIGKPREINLLYQYFAQNNGGELSIDKLSSNLGVSWITISKYIDVLELLGLIYPVLNTTNPLKQLKARKKIYTNSAFGLTRQENLIDIDTELGLAVESYVLERFLEQNQHIFYFRERDTEVDFIDYERKIGYEVKFRSDIQPKHLKNLVKISQKQGLQPKTITLFHTFLDNNNIACLPACLF